MVESLRKLDKALGPEFKIGVMLDDKPASLTLGLLAKELADRMIKLFQPDSDGRIPAFGKDSRFHDDPHWRNLLLFHEYFHAETGKGLGASHQTWTNLVAAMIDEWRRE